MTAAPTPSGRGGSRPRETLAGNAEFWAGAFWLALSAFVTYSGHDLGIGSASDPGPGFVLFWTGLLMGGLALFLAVRAAAKGSPTIASFWAGTRWGKVLIVIICLVAYAALFDTLGFVLATLPLMLVLLRAVDPVRWRVAVPLALGATLGGWWVLRHLLLIQLPAGVFEIG